MKKKYNNMVRKLSDLEKEILDSTKEFALSNGIHYDEMTKNLVLNALREYAVRTECEIKPIEKEIPKGQYPKFMKIYSDWYNEKVGVPIKIDSMQGSHMKQIIKYLISASKNKSEDGALVSWEYILKNWDSLDSFLKNQIKINQINSNLPNILNQLINGKSSKTNSHSNSSRSEAKKFLSNAVSGKSGE